MLVHNLNDSRQAKGIDYSQEFEKGARDYLASNPEDRKAGLLALKQRDDWQLAHPTLDHVLPLYVTLGAGEGASEYRVWSEGLYSAGMSLVSFRLGTVH